jgi:hypothetical protein
MKTSSPSDHDPNRRRSQRVILNVPITVSGMTSIGPFTEKTHTLVISAHGALIVLAAKISPGQIVELQSSTSAEKQACRVVHGSKGEEGKTQWGLEFIEPAPHFWPITFPPADWDIPS